MKSCGDFLGYRRAGQQVASQLLDGKLVERHPGIERINHPVAVSPTVAQLVGLEAVRVGVSREVEPAPRPFFTVLRVGQQAIDHSPVLTAGRVGEKIIDLARLRRTANQVEKHSASLLPGLGQGRRCHPKLGQAIENEVIHGVGCLFRLGQARQFRSTGALIGPVVVASDNAPMTQESTYQQKCGKSDNPNRTDTINGMTGCHRVARKLAFPFYFANGIRGKRETIKIRLSEKKNPGGSG